MDETLLIRRPPPDPLLERGEVFKDAAKVVLGPAQRGILDTLRLHPEHRLPTFIFLSDPPGTPYRNVQKRERLDRLKELGLIEQREGFVSLAAGVNVPDPLPSGRASMVETIAEYRRHRG